MGSNLVVNTDLSQFLCCVALVLGCSMFGGGGGYGYGGYGDGYGDGIDRSYFKEKSDAAQKR